MAITGNIFNIGSAHTQKEANNTIARLGMSAQIMDGKQKTWINDGPPTWPAEISLINKQNKTLKWLVDNKITEVIMAGHSRGAYLCNMIASYIPKHNILRQQIQSINIINLDPVKKAQLADHVISKQINVKRYHTIIMLHENKNELFPFHIADVQKNEDYEIRYTIPMPGKHGSGTQPLTSSIGKVVYEMIKKFMRNRGTEFHEAVWTPRQFCIGFARIHELEPIGTSVISRGRRKIYDDKSNAQTHHQYAWSWESQSKKRTGVYTGLKTKDTSYSMKRTKVITGAGTGGKPVDEDLLGEYFFNLQHLRYFYKAFPEIFNLLRFGKAINKQKYQQEKQDFLSQPTLNKTKDPLENMIGHPL